MINLSIIGLGKWGLELVKSVNKDSKVVRFSSVISRNPERIKKEAKKYHLSIYKNYNDLLKIQKLMDLFFVLHIALMKKKLKNFLSIKNQFLLKNL